MALTDGLLAYWKLDNNSNDSVGSSNGSDTSVSYSQGKIYLGGEYNGSTSTTIISNTLASVSSLTVSMWVRPDSSLVEKKYFCRDWNGGTDWGFFLGQDATTHFSCGVKTTINWRTISDTSTYLSLFNSVWYHLAMTYDGTTLRLYKNGVQVSSSALSETMETTTNKELRIGCLNSTTQLVDAGIDEVGFWDRALTSVEVESLYNGGTGVTYSDATFRFFAVHTLGQTISQANGTSNPMGANITINDQDTVLVAMIVTASATLRTGGSPTYAGKVMTQAGSTQQAASAPETSVELWYLLQPPVGTSTVSVPNSGGLTVRIVLATGRSQTGGSALDVAGGNTGTSTNPTATISTLKDGDIIFSVVGTGATTWQPSLRNGNQIQDSDNGANGMGTQYILQYTSGSTDGGWTFGTSDDWAICMAAFKTASAPLNINNYKFAESVSAGVISVTEKIR